MFGQNGRVKDFGKSTLHKKKRKKNWQIWN